jgi:hypothetical protein
MKKSILIYVLTMVIAFGFTAGCRNNPSPATPATATNTPTLSGTPTPSGTPDARPVTGVFVQSPSISIFNGGGTGTYIYFTLRANSGSGGTIDTGTINVGSISVPSTGGLGMYYTNSSTIFTPGDTVGYSMTTTAGYAGGTFVVPVAPDITAPANEVNLTASVANNITLAYNHGSPGSAVFTLKISDSTGSGYSYTQLCTGTTTTEYTIPANSLVVGHTYYIDIIAANTAIIPNAARGSADIPVTYKQRVTELAQ